MINSFLKYIIYFLVYPENRVWALQSIIILFLSMSRFIRVVFFSDLFFLNKRKSYISSSQSYIQNS